jgi:hypothetical protein
MQDANQDEGFKAFTESVEIIGKLGQQLAALQADVAAIERLRVDENGDAEALVKVDVSGSFHIGLRLSPSTMLSVKRAEVVRATSALKAKFGEILDHAEALCERCKPGSTAQLATRPMTADVDVLERMTRDMKEEIGATAERNPDVADRDSPLAPPSRFRLGPPRLRDSLLSRRPTIAAAE